MRFIGINLWYHAFNDLLIYSATFKKHLERLVLVLKRLKKRGVKVKPSECSFFKKEISHLGEFTSAADPKNIIATSSKLRKKPASICVFLV